MANPLTVSVQLLGKSYDVGCKPEDQQSLKQAGLKINQMMLDIKKTAPNLSQEKLLVLSALTLCTQLGDNEKNSEETYKSARLLEKMIVETRHLSNIS